ncbi:MAG: glycosyltransferase, partial [Bacteroidota bacterium]
VTGLITPPGSAAAMTDALVCLAGDPMLRAELGQAGQAFVFPRYHYQRLVADTRELYLRLIS